MHLSFKFDFELYRIQNKKRNKISCIIFTIEKIIYKPGSEVKQRDLSYRIFI